MRRTPRACLTCVITVLSASALCGQERSIDVVRVPACLSASERAELESQRSGLRDQIKDYNEKVFEFRGRCGQVPNGDTALLHYCQREQASMEKVQEGLVRAASNFRFSVDAAVEAAKTSSDQRVQNLRAEIERDKHALADLGFQGDAEALEEWAKLREKERAEFEKVRLDAMVTVLLESAAGTAAYLRSLNPWSVNTKIRQLKGSTWDQPIIRDTLRKISRIRGKPTAETRVAYAKAVVEALMQGKHAAEALVSEDSVVALMGIAQLSVLLLRNPVTQIEANEAISAFSILYCESRSRAAVPDVDKLMQLDDRKMVALNQISKLLKQHVAQLNAAKQDLTALEACH